MTWALKFDGANDYATFTPVSFVGDCTVIIDCVSLDGVISGAIIGKSSGSGNSWYGDPLTNNLFEWELTLRGGTRAPITYTPIIDKQIEITLDVTGLTKTHTIDGNTNSTTTTNNTGAMVFEEFGRTNTGFYPSIAIIRCRIFNSSSVLVHDWDATLSSHAAGTPILTDTVGSNNATGVNMPTDGSAWVDLGGSGISLTVSSTLPNLSSLLSLNYTTTSNDSVVSSLLPSLLSSLSLTKSDNVFDSSVTSVLPSLTSILGLSVVNPGNNTGIVSELPSLLSTLNLTKSDPIAGAVITSTLPSLSASLSLTKSSPEFNASIVSILPSLNSSLSLYNGVLGISVGDRNNINIVVKSTNINAITKSRNIEEY
jgi:hypothetical protein